MTQLYEDSDPGHYGLAKEVLRVIFGLEANTIGKVMRAIKSSEDASDVKTNLIRTRIGARAVKYLRNSIEIARHEGNEKHEKSNRERDLEKEPDLEPSQLAQERDRKMRTKEKEKTNEGFSFKDFLVKEGNTTVNIDPDDPAATKREIALARQNPDRANRQQTADAKNDRQQAQRDGDPVATKIATLRMQLKQLEMKQAKQQDREV